MFNSVIRMSVLAVFSLAFSNIHAADRSPTEIFQGNLENRESLNKFIDGMVESVRESDYYRLNNLISAQYSETAAQYKKVLQSQGVNVDDYDKRILNDFNFYDIVGVNGVYVHDDVAFIDASVRFKSSFVATHHGPLNGDQTGALFSNLGGYGLAKGFESDLLGNVKYYLIKQNGMWKIHYSYFSTAPMDALVMKHVEEDMEALKHPASKD